MYSVNSHKYKILTTCLLSKKISKAVTYRDDGVVGGKGHDVGAGDGRPTGVVHLGADVLHEEGHFPSHI